ncbi:hypothetical protein EXIGLDRAFT_343464 [Exidia glandulosa HHB12029]|uniref:SnoaL-like domain-containing protein n=1 Tax=Exidia glandulosa HHB12029 TaxID=1314781 RepID=A0A165LI74_EXIGL|nr:hypothetical protein EXIGLDRAFT_343464 [Exidia glandulosa HHB12029]
MAAPPTTSKQLQTVLSWMEAYNAWDVDAIASHLTDDYHHYTLPQSLGRPVATSREQYVDSFRQYQALFTAFHVVPSEIIETHDKIVLHASSTGTSATGALYANEYIIIVTLREGSNGSYAISNVKEFVDSRFNADFFAAERERVAEKTTQAAS